MTRKQTQPINILMADDDEDDRLLTVDALQESRVLNNLFCVEDGVELLEFLRHEGKYSDPASAPRPSLILLDLNMPRKDGREALQELKNDPKLRSIPVVILTTSKKKKTCFAVMTLDAPLTLLNRLILKA